MTTFARPEDYAALDDEGLSPIVDPSVAALNRIATAVEQIALTLLDKPGNGLAPLPPVAAPRAAQAAPSGVCPVHRQPWKTVPGGVSKKTGRPYDAFLACPERGCDQRPA